LNTDKAIQEVIRGPAFAGVTMLTIAHRLNTILDNSDRILVMDGGRVAEFDAPASLLAKPNSMFYSLANEAGLINTDAKTRPEE
jgi:ABC-type multidrug transport system fused ATPase/permease subunit